MNRDNRPTQIPVADVVGAYEALKPLGWKPRGGTFGHCKDKTACALAALAISIAPAVGTHGAYITGSEVKDVLRDHYRVSESYIQGFIRGFDNSSSTGIPLKSIRYNRGYNRGVEVRKRVFGK